MLYINDLIKKLEQARDIYGNLPIAIGNETQVKDRKVEVEKAVLSCGGNIDASLMEARKRIIAKLEQEHQQTSLMIRTFSKEWDELTPAELKEVGDHGVSKNKAFDAARCHKEMLFRTILEMEQRDRIFRLI